MVRVSATTKSNANGFERSSLLITWKSVWMEAHSLRASSLFNLSNRLEVMLSTLNSKRSVFMLLSFVCLVWAPIRKWRSLDNVSINDRGRPLCPLEFCLPNANYAALENMQDKSDTLLCLCRASVCTFLAPCSRSLSSTKQSSYNTISDGENHWRWATNQHSALIAKLIVMIMIINIIFVNESGILPF